MEHLIKDFRHAARGLLRTPAYTLPLVVTLALGLGVNTAVWSVLSAALLRPLPFPHGERLMRVYELFALASAEGGMATGAVSVPNLRDWQEQAKSFTALVPYNVANVTLQASGQAERLEATEAGDRLFEVLGTRPLLGRALQPGDVAAAERAPVAVLSYGLWKRRFAGDEHVLGRTLRIDGQAYTVVGVMPAGFTYPLGGTPMDVWLPLQIPRDQIERRGSHWLAVVGRLRPGVSAASAQAEMDGILRTIAKANPDAMEGRGVRVMPMHEALVGRVRPKLMIVAAAAALVLLIACANAASLLLARAVARRRELGVRAALGASDARLARQLLAEALLVAGAGGVIGLLLAQPTVRLLAGLAKNVLVGGTAVGFDYRVFLFVVLAATLTALATALAPVLHLRRTALRDELQAGSTRTGGDRSTRVMRSGLVVAQVALSTVLLVGTGLLLKSLGALLAVDTGIDTEHVVAINTSQAADPGPEADARRALTYERVLERVSAMPGIQAAAWTSHLPLRDWGTNGNFSVEGIPDPPAQADKPFAELRGISPGYFDVLRVPLLRGRTFLPAEDSPAAQQAPERVAIVNQALVDAFFHGHEPIGRHLENIFDKPMRIVGVVRSFRQTTLDQKPRPEIYIPVASFPLPEMVLMVRSALPIQQTVPMLRSAMREVAPDLPVFEVTSMDEVVEQSVSDRRLVLSLIAAFAGLALLLSAAGIYGLLAYLVAQGRREISIRMALGAARRAVLASVLGPGARMLGLGLAIGVALAFVGSRVLGSFLYGVRVTDVPTLAGVVATLALVSLLALWLPAVRAMRTDPSLVLREDA